MPTLVIVESPTKARTIRKYLPGSYRVEASVGHVRDLPPSAEEIPPKFKGEAWAKLGVNVDAGFEPLYVVPKDKQKIVKDLKAALKEADELVLATDEDREGESISWHLLELLKPKVPVKRMVFHEITREAIQKALSNCRSVDENLVRAQETRRILDRLVGYTLSPLLGEKITRKLPSGRHPSAGRVQSVAVRLLVQRERERRAFKSGSYWDLKANLEKDNIAFEAKLVTLDGQRLATGADFDASTGKIAANKRAVLLDEAQAMALKARLADKPWSVSEVEAKQVTRKPAPPFTTSTLQQEANRKLGLSAKDSMRVAQGLYEQGYITYMRTDSVHLSQEAVAAARSCIESLYGKNYLSPKPRKYTTKSKGAQEAHEAIRPSGSTFRTPDETGLKGRDRGLYDLIWKRTVACQMAEARLTQLGVKLTVEDAGFRASGKRIDFPGFFRAYVEGSDDPEAALENQETLLPDLAPGDCPDCKQLEASGHETQPPARFTEASLVKTLESEGIGRPSTYASIMGRIVETDYAKVRGNALVPTFAAFAVTRLLEENFQDLVDPHFTARMEDTLDEVATGSVESTRFLEEFYRGEQGLVARLEAGKSAIDPDVARAILLDDLEIPVRIGSNGPFVEEPNSNGDGEKPTSASIPEDIAPADLTTELAVELLRRKKEGPEKLGLHPETGEPIFVAVGRYGPYVQLGEKTEANKKPKSASLPKGVTPEEATLELAVGLLSLPRKLGVHPETGRPVRAGRGPYGAYIVHELGKDPETGKVKKDYRSLKGDDDVLTVGLERAVELLAQPKRGRGRGQAKTPLRELGAHPESGEAINIYEGPYGTYINQGKVNASLPEGYTVENITLEKALAALDEKAATKKTTTRKKSTTTNKKTTATRKKTTAAKKAK